MSPIQVTGVKAAPMHRVNTCGASERPIWPDPEVPGSTVPFGVLGHGSAGQADHRSTDSSESYLGVEQGRCGWTAAPEKP